MPTKRKMDSSLPPGRRPVPAAAMLAFPPAPTSSSRPPAPNLSSARPQSRIRACQHESVAGAWESGSCACAPDGAYELMQACAASLNNQERVPVWQCTALLCQKGSCVRAPARAHQLSGLPRQDPSSQVACCVALYTGDHALPYKQLSFSCHPRQAAYEAPPRQACGGAVCFSQRTQHHSIWTMELALPLPPVPPSPNRPSVQSFNRSRLCCDAKIMTLPVRTALHWPLDLHLPLLLNSLCRPRTGSQEH